MASTRSGYEAVPTNDSFAALPVVKPAARRSYAKIFSLFFAFVLVSVASYKLGQWSAKEPVPATTSSQPTKSAVTAPAATTTATPEEQTDSVDDTATMPSHGKYNVGYFVNWGIYGRKFPPQLIPANDLTHILYAFANVKPDSGEVVISDSWADQEIHYPGDSWNEPQHENLYGNFKAIYLLKKQHRHLKVLLSIGGWTYSPNFHPVVVNPSLRAKFVESAVKLLEDYGLDGLDVDYEYPSDDHQARGYVDLLKELRHALDRHAQAKQANYRFLLTIAAPCGPDNYKKLHAAEMDKYLDFWNMMSYDFAGSWDSVANHQANLHGPPLNAADAIHWYINKGVARDKIVLGIPLYGRSFMETKGPGSPFNGIGPGSWEKGVYDYRALPLPGSYIHRDEKAGASWAYDYSKKEMVSFDTDEVARWKGEWIKKEGFAGGMYWELSGDKGNEKGREAMEKGPGKDYVPGPSLVRVVKDAMGGLDMSENWLKYEGSKFTNIRNGMA